MNNFKSFEQKITPHIEDQIKNSTAIKDIYIKNNESMYIDSSVDLLNEKIAAPVHGTVQKYPGQILILLSNICAAHCRYCERQDRVGEGKLSKKQIDDIITYIKNNHSIHEVIASGGDPLLNPVGLEYLFERLKKIEHIKIMRIHTRFPIQSPKTINKKLLKKLLETNDVIYMILHVDHPDELDSDVKNTIKYLRKLGYILLCQTVFLKGINDNLKILKKLFLELYRLGVKPYYIYHCQEVQTTKKFIVPLDDEINLMTKLKQEIPGIAFPQHVIDVPGGYGKIQFPTKHWDYNIEYFKDYKNNKFSTKNWSMIK